MTGGVVEGAEAEESRDGPAAASEAATDDKPGLAADGPAAAYGASLEAAAADGSPANATPAGAAPTLVKPQNASVNAAVRQ
jgi:hypothetical protein